MTQFSFPHDSYPRGYSSETESRRTAIIDNRDKAGLVKRDTLKMSVTVDNTYKTAVVTVNAGKALVDGAYLTVSEDVVFNVNWLHIDTTILDALYFSLVIVSNRSSEPVTSAKGAGDIIDYLLFFPDNLIDYEYNSSVGEGTARLAIIVENNPFYYNLYHFGYIFNNHGSTYIQPSDMIMYDMDTSANLTNPVHVDSVSFEENYVAIVSSSHDGEGSVIIYLSDQDSCDNVITGTLLYPMRTATGFDNLAVNLTFGWPMSTSSVQKIYFDDTLITQVGSASNIYLSSGYEEEWSVLHFNLRLTRHYNYLLINGTLMFTVMGENYMGFSLWAKPSYAELEEVTGIIYGGNTTELEEIGSIQITPKLGDTPYGCGSIISQSQI